MYDGPIKILLIEDNPGDARLFREFLVESRVVQFDVTHKQRLEAGLSCLAEEDINVVLLDLGLPGTQGLEALEQVHTHRPEMPIVVLTGMDDENLAVSALQAGAQDYLVKGEFDSNLLVRAIRYAIEREGAEATLQESEEKYRLFVENAIEGIVLLDTRGKVVEVNPRVVEIAEMDREELVGKNILQLIPTIKFDKKQVLSAIKRAVSGKLESKNEYKITNKSGRQLILSASLTPVKKGFKVKWLSIIIEDITERKRAEVNLQWESSVNETLANMSRALIVPTYSIREIAEVVLDSAKALTRSEHGFVNSIDPKTGDNLAHTITQMLGERGHFMMEDQQIVFPIGPDGKYPKLWGHALNTGKAFFTNSPHTHEASGGTPEGHVPLKNFLAVPAKIGDELVGLVAVANSANDYCERDLNALQRLTDLYAVALQRRRADTLIRNQRDMVLALSVTPGLNEGLRICVEAALHASGMDCGGVYLVDETSRSLDLVFHKGLPPDFVRSASHYDEDSPNGQLVMTGKPIYTKHLELGVPMDEAQRRESLRAVAVVPIQHEGLVIGCLNIASHTLDEVPVFARDSIEAIAAQIGSPIARLRTEEALRESEGRYRSLFESNHSIMLLLDPKTRHIVDANPAACSYYGYDKHQLTSKKVNDIALMFEDMKDLEMTFLNNLGDKNCYLFKHRLASGEIRDVEAYVGPITVNGRDLLYAIIHDVSERVKVEAESARRLKNLTALRTIDHAITSNLNLSSTLEVVLDQVMDRLQVDAADILLYESPSQTLLYAGGRGFHSAVVTKTDLRVGRGCAGQVVLERRMIRILDISVDACEVEYTPSFWKAEGFVSYFGVPLIAKGQVKGVLEVYHRSVLDPDPDWLSFLDTLAGQAAISIDNATLFEGLQRSNLELTLAYETTLEGWAKTLELRDNETEGHSQRVTDMTVRIAQAMGMGEDELVHVQRGALLHDIGKMGMPDSILHKPGKLTAEEWETMKQHTVWANNLLSPINFLRPALDIPHYHHEKWDGSGYPQGLKGEQIPLAARIFAIVDVWDALLSDRPYRKAWSEERACKYIQNQSGLHFDPRVVEMFFELVDLLSFDV